MSLSLPSSFVAGLAQECAFAAGKLKHLQTTFGEEIGVVSASDSVVREIQALDSVQQTLCDLSRILDQLSQVAAEDGDNSEVVATAVASAKQASLRGRLLGAKDSLCTVDVDLF